MQNTNTIFLVCTFCRNELAELICVVSSFCRVTVDCLLYGNNDLSYQTNVHIFEALQANIKNSKRF